MIVPNVSKRSYTFEATSVATKTGSIYELQQAGTLPTHTISDPGVLSAWLGIGLGARLTPEPSMFGDEFGVSITRQIYYDTLLGQDLYRWRVQFGYFAGPNGGNVYDTGWIAGWRPDISVKVEIDGVLFDTIDAGHGTHNPCYGYWLFTCDDIKFYLDGALVYQRGSSHSMNGDYAAPEQNVTTFGTTILNLDSHVNSSLTKCCYPMQYDPLCTGDMVFLSPWCPDFHSIFGQVQSRLFDCTVNMNGYWRAIDDATQTVYTPSLILYAFPGQTPCTGICAANCVVTMPNVSVPLGQSVETESKFHYEYSLALVDTFDCSFTTTIGGTVYHEIARKHHVIYAAYLGKSKVVAVDKDASYLTTTRKDAKAICTCEGGVAVDTFLITSNDTDAYCGQDRRILSKRYESDCFCSELVVGPAGTDCPPYPSNIQYSCIYSINNTLDYQPVTCSNPDVEGAGVSITHDPSTDEYHLAYTSGGHIFVRRSNYSTPIYGWITLIKVTSTGTNTEPAIEVEKNGTMDLLYTVSGTGVVRRTSFDHGNTWSTPTTMFSNGAHGRVCAGKDGSLLFMASKYISGSSGPKKLYVISMSPGDIPFPAEVVAKNSSSVDIEINDESFDISPAYDGGYLLTCKKNGSTTISHFVSHDYGKTWTEIV